MTINVRQDDEWSPTVQSVPKTFRPSPTTIDSLQLVPFVDNLLYFDPNSLIHVATTSLQSGSLQHALTSSRRKLRHHHHHHHYHHHHHHHRHHHRKHRRVVSDPGTTRNWDAVNQEVKRHRRLFSFDTGVDASAAEDNEEATPPDDTNTSTFRKVPWHPNLHMLKLRRT